MGCVHERRNYTVCECAMLPSRGPYHALENCVLYTSELTWRVDEEHPQRFVLFLQVFGQACTKGSNHR